MDKSFAPGEVEPRWRRRWEELRIGSADPDAAKPFFTIALPPPNITGALHLGHAAGGSVQDILARHRRMLGTEVEWCPGTDHAALATNAVIERQLAAEGTSKEEIGRAAFHARVDAWYAEYGGRIHEQMRELGFTCDWERSRFTLDAGYVRAIRVVFKTLHDEGLIYRGPRIVNWCPHCHSAISDEEIDWQEHTDTLVELRYPVDGGGDVTVATVRPETMLGDTAVAVHPADPRYTGIHGRSVLLPLSGRRVPVVEDEAARMDFGTGALKVTPGHDPIDYEIGQRHGLPLITVIDAEGRMDVPALPAFHGLPAAEARVAVTAALRELGVVGAETPYVHEVGHCDRCGTVLEPQISEQWWVRMRTLAEPAIAVVESGEVRFHPGRYADGYLAWMRGLKDWCISRQIWLGHAVPVSLCANGHRFAWVDEPSVCPECGSEALRPDPDVLDTWFSSALWPFAIFGWPDATRELTAFYPTSALVTDRGIINLWVARMIMTGLKFAGAKPFTDVIITATIQAPDGSRMSKSKGNALDPLVMIERYGADAVRAWAGAVGTSGQDMRFDEERIKSYRNFANKLWNATRFVVGRVGEEPLAAAGVPGGLLLEDRWILARVAACVAGVDHALRVYRFHDAMERLYDTIWHGYCDWYLEAAKARLRDDAEPASRAAAAWTALTCLDVLLRCLHPFMPFVTEECAQQLPGAAATLQRRDWPQAAEIAAEGSSAAGSIDPGAFDSILELVGALRNARQAAGVPASSRERQPLLLEGGPAQLSRGELVRLVEALAPVTVVDAAPAAGVPTALVAGGFEALLHAGGAGVDRGRLDKQLAELEDRVRRVGSQLDNQGFVAKARPEVVEEARRRLADATQERDSLRRLLEEGAA
ncbi:MAG: valine--tRNA ligase [Candidatus Dormibacteria bacterium]